MLNVCFRIAMGTVKEKPVIPIIFPVIYDKERQWGNLSRLISLS